MDAARDISVPSVVAVVVTFNRVTLLLRCLAALDQQTRRPDRIVVVDNSSTDGTVERLRAGDWLNRSDVELLTLERNLGGAGGFAAGWEKVLSSQMDWIWTMDDDGYPASDCLEKLLEVAARLELEAVSPIQVDISDASRPAFPAVDARGKLITELPYHPPDGDPFIPAHANLFNGLLIKSAAVLMIGLPRAELFVRGDEVEYTYRMTKQGLRFGTLASACFFHPSDRDERHHFLGGIGFARDAHNDFKNYYMYRNKGLAFRENGWLWMLPFDALRYLYYFLIHKRGDVHGLKLWARAMRDGLSKRLGRHPDF